MKENLALNVDMADLTRQLLNKGFLTTIIVHALLRDPVEAKDQICIGISEAARATNDECVQMLRELIDNIAA